MKITIAIDGYSACGKSTVAKALAAQLGYKYVDTGAMYRSVTLYCLQKGILKDGKFFTDDVINALDNIHLSFQYNPSRKASDIYLNKENVEHDIRTMEVSNNVSHISVVKEVRDAMKKIQRRLGKDKAIVMDGRDIGTNIFPNAELKIFMTADTDIRTQRRFDELKSKGTPVTFEEVKKNLMERDYEDSHRKESPLKKADDAVVLDNSDLTKEEQLEFVLKLLEDLKLQNK